jgi:hypothetical protein
VSQVPLAKRVSLLMAKMLSHSKGPVPAGELVAVVNTLRSCSSNPNALHLADALESIPIGSSVSEEARSALTEAVFEWQASSL